MRCDVEVNGRTRSVDVERLEGALVVRVDGRRLTTDVTVINGVWSVIVAPDGMDVRRSYQIAILEEPPGSGNLTMHVDGRVVSASVDVKRKGTATRRGHDAASAGAAPGGPGRVTAPMPGKVVKVLVRPGDTVAARQGVVVVEAMKMENELRSPRAGRVAEINVAEGASVEAGAILAVIE